MRFTDEYISTTENTATPDATKTLLSDDAYAIGSTIEQLIDAIKGLAIKIK